MLRRILIAVVVIFAHWSWLIKSCFMMSNTFVMLLVIVHCKVYETRLEQRLEVFNEFCLLVTTYFLFIFTDWVPDEYTRSFMGWAFIGLFVFCMFINILIVTIIAFISLYKSCRKSKCCLSKSVKKGVKKEKTADQAQVEAPQVPVPQTDAQLANKYAVQNDLQQISEVEECSESEGRVPSPLMVLRQNTVEDKLDLSKVNVRAEKYVEVVQKGEPGKLYLGGVIHSTVKPPSARQQQANVTTKQESRPVGQTWRNFEVSGGANPKHLEPKSPLRNPLRQESQDKPR